MGESDAHFYNNRVATGMALGRKHGKWGATPDPNNGDESNKKPNI